MLNLNRAFLVIMVALCGLFSAVTVSAARLYFSPSTLSLKEGEQATITMYVDSQGVPINSAEINVSFPTDIVRVESISKTGSLFSLWIEEPAYSNAEGTVHFNGGLPSPGYTGTSGKLASVRITAKKSGNASFSFVSSSVTANDGLGTNVLASQAPASVAVVEPVPIQKQTTPSAPTVASTKFAITSPTHPDQDGWYKTKDPSFAWKVPGEASAIRLSISQDEREKPSVLYKPPISEKTVNSLDDGIWYFTAQTLDASKTWSPISTYTVRIDTIPPVWQSLEEKSIQHDKQQFTVVASDVLSGIDHFEMKIDDGNPARANIKDDVYEIEAPSGDHILYAVVYDKAGNSSAKTIAFSVPEAPVSGSDETKNLDTLGFAEKLTEINKLLVAVVEFVALIFFLLFILIMGTKKLLSMRPMIAQIEHDLMKDHSPEISKACSDGTCSHEGHQVLRG